MNVKAYARKTRKNQGRRENDESDQAWGDVRGGKGGGGNNTGGGTIVIRATVESFGRKMWCITCRYSKITSSPVPALSFWTTHYPQGQRDQSNCQLMCDATNAITLQSLFETSRNYITLKLFYSNTLSSQSCRRSQSYHGKTLCFINNPPPAPTVNIIKRNYGYLLTPISSLCLGLRQQALTVFITSFLTLLNYYLR